MRIAITGATGLVGRNLLFEVIKQNFDGLDNLEIYIMGGSKNQMDIEQRIESILLEDGMAYLNINKQEDERIKKFIKKNLKFIPIDLTIDKLGIAVNDMDLLKSISFDYFFHVASLVNIINTPQVKKQLWQINVAGAQRLVEILKSMNVREFLYVSTAFVSGDAAGDILPDSINVNAKFQNPYQKSKLEAELIFRRYGQETGARCRFFRLSVVGGRLIEQQLGATNKFDVFYSPAAFLFQLRIKYLKQDYNNFDIPLDLTGKVRYYIKPGSSQNIVSADFVAKAIYQICQQNDPGESYHIANGKETSHNVIMDAVLESLNVKGIEIIDHNPDMYISEIERDYYQFIGKILNPVIYSQQRTYNTDNIKQVLKESNLATPEINKRAVSILMEYARENNFGFRIHETILN
jgi:nucleoside-diphosphate-sugar epimerase